MVTFVINALMVLNVVVEVIIINLILMQKSKSGGGLGGINGGGGGVAEEVFGSGTANVLSRATVIFSLIGSYLISHSVVAALAGRFIGDQPGSQWWRNGLQTPGLSLKFEKLLTGCSQRYSIPPPHQKLRANFRFQL